MKALNKQAYRADGGDIGAGRLKEIADNAYGDEEKRWLAQRVLSLLDENLQLQRDKDSLEAVAIAMRDDMRDAREKLEELDNALCELLPGTQYMDPPDGGSVTPLEQVRRMVADYRERIEELESRTVDLPKRRVGEVMHMSGFSRDYAEGWCSGNDNAIQEIRAAGIGVKEE